jgi:hypothetical protein
VLEQREQSTTGIEKLNKRLFQLPNVESLQKDISFINTEDQG